MTMKDEASAQANRWRGVAMRLRTVSPQRKVGGRVGRLGVLALVYDVFEPVRNFV